MHIAHGPPGASGVTSLMSVGADDIEGFGEREVHKTARTVGLLSTAMWIYGWSTNDPKLKKMGLGVGLAALAVELLSSPR